MSSPQEQGVQVSMESVIAVQRRRIAELSEANIMLEAALSDKERQLAALLKREE